MSTPKRILVTSGLPYANGQLHLGHMVEAIQTDVWCRFHRMLGHECYYVCAEDGHGTPVMLRAQREGIDAVELIEHYREEHLRDYTAFGIQLAEFHTTHSEENRLLVESFYESWQERGHLERRTVRQFYDSEREMFLPDRFVKGTCPRCQSPDQNGDSCDNCGATYTPQDLIDPVSALTGSRPEERDSEHIFFRISDFEDVLEDWLSTERLQSEVVNKLREWFDEGLKDWDISREPPYFGFEIPDAPGKYFYVWVDAPIGYLASFAVLCDRLALDFDDYFREDAGEGESATEVYHFIGKDIVYFHCLFWPAMLSGAGLRLPSSVFVHGFLTVGGTKMSKSRGTFIEARTYLEHLPPDPLRYYLAAKLGSGLGDIDLNLEDFVHRVNSDLVGKVANIASRCAGFLHRSFAGRLGAALDRPELVARAAEAGNEVAELYRTREYNRALRRVLEIADDANRYIDDEKPWLLAKDPEQSAKLHAVLTTGINLFRILVTYLKPVVPFTAEKSERFLAVEPLVWSDAQTPLLDHATRKFEPLLARIEGAQVAKVIEDSKEPAATTDRSEAGDGGDSERHERSGGDVEPIADEISFGDFAKVDLRVARIERAEAVEGAGRLLSLELDLGGTKRTVLAGIKEHYRAQDLVGRLTVVVANLAPKKMRFGTSQGMVLAAGDDSSGVFLLAPDSGARPGQRVR